MLMLISGSEQKLSRLQQTYASLQQASAESFTLGASAVCSARDNCLGEGTHRGTEYSESACSRRA